MKRLVFLCVILCSSLFSLAQSDTSNYKWEDVAWDEAMNMFYDPGYITVTGGVGNIEKLIFEANIIPYYTIGLNAISKWALVLSPQVIIRMYNEDSWPIKTPSYKPRVILVHQSTGKNQFHDWFQYVSWYHHSNGQSGEFFRDDSTFNWENGSFSTNWIEAGVFASRAHRTREYYAKLYGSYCYAQDTMQNGLFGRFRLNFDLKFDWNIAKTLSNINIHFCDNKNAYISNTLRVGYIGGDVDLYDRFDWKRFIIDYTISFRPGFLQDVTLFAQYYWGEDYYNIYFNRILHVFRVGITAQSKFFTRGK